MTLGILQLQNTPMTHAGCMGNPRSFRYPVIYHTVPGAWVSNVVPGDPSLAGAFADGAKALVDRGARAVTSNCGFTVRYQAAVSSSVAAPVSMSSLLLLPSLLRALAPGRKVGVLTYDSRSFSDDVLAAAGVDASPSIVVRGLEGTMAYEIMLRPVVEMPPKQLETDVVASVQALLQNHPEISALLFECVGFCPVTAVVRHSTRLPVFDAITNADLMMAGVGSPAAAASP